MRYKFFEDEALYGKICGLQLVFSNGVETPLYQTFDAQKYRLKTQDVLPYQMIKSIAMKMSSKSPYVPSLTGLRISDHKDVMLLNLDLDTTDEGNW